eukprot:403348718
MEKTSDKSDDELGFQDYENEEYEEIKVIDVDNSEDLMAQKAKTLDKKEYKAQFDQFSRQKLAFSEAQVIHEDFNNSQYRDQSDYSNSSQIKSSRGGKRTIEDFEMHQVLGEGSYGKHQKVESVFRERDILKGLSHPNIIKQYFTFQDDVNLYFVFEYASRGSLTKIMSQINLCEKMPIELRFEARKYLSNRGLASKNYFGDSYKLENSQDSVKQDAQYLKRKATFVGTPLYVSPEMLKDNTSSKAGDIWALGCIIYQMITGEAPFKAHHDYQTFQLILNRTIEFPECVQEEAKDLIDKLLQLDPQQRIGTGDPSSDKSYQAIKDHPFFQGINWENLSKNPVHLPQSLASQARKHTTIKKNIKHENRIIEDIKRGLLKKRNEYYIQQTRSFVLTNEPTLKYYKNDNNYRGEIVLSRGVYARRSGRDRFEIVTPNSTYFLKEIKPGDSDQWINAINIAINQYCSDKQ